MDRPIEQAKSSRQEAKKLLDIFHQDILGGHTETLRIDPHSGTGLLRENLEQLPDLQLFLRAATVRHGGSELARILK